MTVYLKPAEFADPPPPFRVGVAGHVWLAEDGDFERDTRVRVSANTAHALIGHGVIDDLNRLPLMGVLGSGRDTVIPQEALGAAADLLYRADRNTYGAEWEFEVGMDAAGRRCRVRIDNREYQRGLLRLTDLLNAASRVGFAAWMRL